MALWHILTGPCISGLRHQWVISKVVLYYILHIIDISQVIADMIISSYDFDFDVDVDGVDGINEIDRSSPVNGESR